MTRTPYSRNLGLTAILLAAFAVSMILLDRYAAYLNYQTVPFDDARQHELARRLVAAAVRRDPSLGDDPMVLRIATVTRSFEQDVAHTLATLAMAPNLKQATAAEIFRALRAGNVAPAVAALTAMQQSGEAIAAGRAALLRLDDRAIALAAYRRIANLSPEPVYAWLKFGHRASHLQAYGDAFAAYERVLKETDIYADRLAAAEAMSGFALVARAQGDTNNAIAFQYEAIRLHEELARTDLKAIAFNHLGLIETANGNLPAAVAAHRQAVDLERSLDRPTELAQALYDLGRTLAADGDVAAACTAWTEPVAGRSLDQYLANRRAAAAQIRHWCGDR